MLDNLKNYGPYQELIFNKRQVIDVSNITVDNWNEYFYGLLNIFKDGIETDFVKNIKIELVFDGTVIKMVLPHLFFNLIMWKMPLYLGYRITANYIFYDCIFNNITKNTIKAYIDKNVIIPNRKKVPNITLNNVIDEGLHEFYHIDKFAFYFANTINIQDDIDMMQKIPEYYDILHADLSNVPLAEVKDEGMKLTNRIIGYIKDSRKYLGYDHCLANAIKAEEGIKPRQYKEANINIGTKPDGLGGVYPAIINKSFINGGVDDTLSYLIESSTGRTAQILSKNNVGDSGAFARILGLNNIDSHLFPDPEYVCDTRNFIKMEVKSKNILKRLIDRYYRFTPDGADILITGDDTFLIGKTILLRSPVTCASAAAGHGICYKCYGDLAFAVNKINIGKFAAEVTTSELTQRLLSAKHLLETSIKKIKWESEYFFDLFEIDGNTIKLLPDLNLKGLSIVLNPDEVYMDNEDDYGSSDDSESIDPTYNEYVKEFVIESKDHKFHKVLRPKTDEKLYISPFLNKAIKSKGEHSEEVMSVQLHHLVDDPIFFIEIHNNELSKAMEKIMNILNKNAVTKIMSKDEIVQDYTEAIIDGNLNPMAIHGEILIMNQVRALDNILEKPNWGVPNIPYQILTLNQGLTSNPSVTIGLLYQRLSRTLCTPLTFKKNKASIVDPFFMEQPQKYMQDNKEMVSSESPESDIEANFINPIIRLCIPDADDALV